MCGVNCFSSWVMDVVLLITFVFDIYSPPLQLQCSYFFCFFPSSFWDIKERHIAYWGESSIAFVLKGKPFFFHHCVLNSACAGGMDCFESMDIILGWFGRSIGRSLLFRKPWMDGLYRDGIFVLVKNWGWMASAFLLFS